MPLIHENGSKQSVNNWEQWDSLTLLPALLARHLRALNVWFLHCTITGLLRLRLDSILIFNSNLSHSFHTTYVLTSSPRLNDCKKFWHRLFNSERGGSERMRASLRGLRVTSLSPSLSHGGRGFHLAITHPNSGPIHFFLAKCEWKC